jgi:hypothetical protein
MSMKDTEENNNLRQIGWAKMSEILDKEMPSKKKKRRLIPFLLSIAGACGLLFIYLQNFERITKEDLENVSKINSTVTEHKSKSQNVIQNQKLNKEQSHTYSNNLSIEKIGKKASKNSTPNSVINSLLKNSILKRNTIMGDPVDNKHYSKANETFINDVQVMSENLITYESKNFIENTLYPYNQIEEGSVIQTKEKDMLDDDISLVNSTQNRNLKINLSPILPLEILQVLSMQKHKIEAIQPMNIPFNPTIVNRSKFGLYTTLGLGSINFKDEFQFSLGLMGSYEINKNFNLSLSTDYVFNNDNFRVVKKIQEVTPLSPASINLLRSLDGNSKIILKAFNRNQFLSSLNLNYSFYKNISFSVGLKVIKSNANYIENSSGFTYSSPDNKFQSGQVLNDINSFDLIKKVGAIPISEKSSNYFDIGDKNNIEISPSFGLGFKLSKRFNLYLDYYRESNWVENDFKKLNTDQLFFKVAFKF